MIPEKLKGFFQNSLKNRILAITILIAIIPFSIIYSYIFFNMKNNMVRDYTESAQESVNKISDLVNQKLLEYVQKSTYIAADKSIIANLSRDFSDDISGKVQFYVNAGHLLDDIGAYNANERGIYTIYYTNKSLFGYKYFKDIADIGDSEFITEQVLGAATSDVIWSPYLTADGGGTQYVPLYRKIQVSPSGFSVLEIQIPFLTIESYLNSIDMPDGGIVVYEDADGQEVTALQGINGSLMPVSSVDLNTKDYFLLDSTFTNSHKIVVALPRSVINRQSIFDLGVMAAIFLAVILSIIFSVILTTNSITKDLKKFISDIKKSDDVLLNNIPIQVARGDEISLIKRRFGDLLGKINELHKANLETEKNKKVLEVELLQSKINPHMLYNSLSVIKWGAIANHDDKTVELVDCMTKYYRSLLNKGSNVIPIREELEAIREYVRINEIAHAATYTLVCDTDEVLDCYTIKLILQPFVENAILHGLNGKAGDKKITISGSRHGGDVILSVEDNGYGMAPETLEKIMSADYNKGFGGYGIKNTLKRIKTYFGGAYGVTITSRLGSFTKVSVCIPAVSTAEAIEHVDL